MPRKVTKETRYVTRVYAFVSSIIGAIEMMRYDTCFPNSEADSHKLEAITNHHDQGPDDHLVCFTRVACNDLTPTTQRWRSFNCRVLLVQQPSEEPATIEQLRALRDVPTVHPSVGER